MALMSQREFKHDKAKDFSDWYNAVIYAADLVDIRYNVQGFIVHKPNAARVLKALYSLFERELEADGHEPVLFPTVIPEENFLKEKEHVEGFAPEVFWITAIGNAPLARRLALRPTSETAFYQMYSLWVKHASDLPLKYYQSCSVFRGEKETNPFLRGREFYWIEAHDAFATQADALAQVKRDNAIFRKVAVDELGVPLLVFQRPQWDKFPGADNTYAYDALLPDGKVLQIGSTHELGQNFSKPFGIEFADETGEKHFAWQTCFGPGLWRVVAALVATHGDEKGIVFPFTVAPVQVVVVPIVKGESRATVEKARKIVAGLRKSGVRAHVDEREKTPGFKFNEWELRGTPLRIEVGEREVAEGTVTLVRRDNRSKLQVKDDALLQAVLQSAADLLQSLREKAEGGLRERVNNAWTLDDVKQMLDADGGFARTAFCSTGMDGKACADELQVRTTGGKVRGTPAFAEEELPAGAACIACGKPARKLVYVARQY